MSIGYVTLINRVFCCFWFTNYSIENEFHNLFATYTICANDFQFACFAIVIRLLRLNVIKSFRRVNWKYINAVNKKSKQPHTQHNTPVYSLQCLLVCQEKANSFMSIAMHIKKNFVHIKIMGCLVIVVTFEISWMNLQTFLLKFSKSMLSFHHTALVRFLSININDYFLVNKNLPSISRYANVPSRYYLQFYLDISYQC